MTACQPRITAANDGPPEPRDLPGPLASLPLVAFPEALWQAARDQVLDRPGRWGELAGDGRWLADYLWPPWAASLEAQGATPGFLAQVVVGYRSELWLWLMGERTWPHIVTSLAGRTLRRAPGAPTRTPQAETGGPS